MFDLKNINVRDHDVFVRLAFYVLTYLLQHISDNVKKKQYKIIPIIKIIVN